MISYQFWSPLATNFEACLVKGQRPKQNSLISLFKNGALISTFRSKEEALGFARNLTEEIQDVKVKTLVHMHFHLIEKSLTSH